MSELERRYYCAGCGKIIAGGGTRIGRLRYHPVCVPEDREIPAGEYRERLFDGRDTKRPLTLRGVAGLLDMVNYPGAWIVRKSVA